MALPEAYNTQMTEEEIAAAFKNAAKVPDLESAVKEQASGIMMNTTNIELNTQHIAANTANVAAAQSEAAVNRTTLGCQGKNLLNVTATSQTINGITFTVNDDKSITVNGTATADAEISLRIISLEPNVNYYLSGCPQGGATTTYHIYSLWIDDYSSGGWDTGSGKIIKNSTESARKIQFRCRIMSGTTVDNLTFYPMLRYAEITDDTYEPYKDSVDARLTALEADTGWVDCLPNITLESLAFDETYTQSAKIRRVGKYVSLRAKLKFVSDGNDTMVRGFLRGIIPTGYRPSEMLFAPMTYGMYNSTTSATYKTFSAQVNGGDLTIFMNDGSTLADIYGYVVRINMGWLLD